MSTPLEYLPQLPVNKQVGIGCIGAGFIMADCHLVAYRQAGFNPVAIASARVDHAREVAQRHSIRSVYATYEELLADPQVEVVDVAVEINETGLPEVTVHEPDEDVGEAASFSFSIIARG